MPTGLEIFEKMRDDGYSGEEAKAELVKFLGFTPTMEQLQLPAEKLKAMRSSAGATGQRPVPEMSVDDRPSLYNPPEEGESFVEMVAEPAAKVAGVIAGVPAMALDAGRDIYNRVSGDQGWVSLDKRVSTPDRSAVAQSFKQTREQLAKESEYRLNKDVYDNWRANVADLSEGTIDLFLELGDLKDKGSEPIRKGVHRAFKEGLALPSAMVGGGAAFLARLAEDPITTMRTVSYTHLTLPTKA